MPCRSAGFVSYKMNIWLRRILMLLFVLFWLALLLMPTLAFVLARNVQVQIGQTEGRHWRLFMLQQADIEGLGLERARIVPAPDDAPESIQCTQTTIDYWMWAGEGQAATFCQCADALSGEIVSLVPPTCLQP